MIENGTKIGKLTIIERGENAKSNKRRICICDCGKTTLVYHSSLVSGSTKSCGCLRSKGLIDLTGKKFNRWSVIEISKNNNSKWLCRCDCGSYKEINGQSLRTSHTKSCGCHKSESTKERMTKHGQAAIYNKTPEYKTWAHMKSRCTNNKVKDYVNYGGRGIKVCEMWSESFESFLGDMGEKPSPNHSIDRIDVNGNYEPSNCRWATSLEQNHNRRRANNNTSGHSGVKWYKRLNKWEVCISHNKKRIYLGVYENIESAISVRKEAEFKYWGKESS